MDWTPILAAAIPASLVFAGVVVTQMGKRDERRMEREQNLESRMDGLERKLEDVQKNLRREQRFSHRMVLMLNRIVFFLRDVADYRARHGPRLPEEPPPMPDPDEIEELLTERPSYRARDEP